MSVALEMGMIDKPLPILTNAKVYSQQFEDLGIGCRTWGRTEGYARLRTS